MKFRTEIDVHIANFPITHRQKLVMLGSCFAENIGERLVNCKFDIDLNPFGITYNPLSAAKAISLLLDEYSFSRSDVLARNGLYFSLMHHGDFSSPDLEQFLQQLNLRREKGSQNLRKADWLILTFGTSYVYETIENRQIVNNCHKLPASYFHRRRLSVTEIVDVWSEIIIKVQVVNPGIRFLFTVSPVRHLKDGAHENQLSKSILLLAIDELRDKFPEEIDYFPSYELILDDLRDYRFYATDMIHPGIQAVEYCLSKFADAYFSEETQLINRKWTEISKALQHRPLKGDTPEYRLFLEKTQIKLKNFQDRYSYILCQREIDELESRISLLGD